ncbi:MAG: hypothetical protein ACYTF7_11060 [Planctomycetota bacterium]|jgi:hypothetical protein
MSNESVWELAATHLANSGETVADYTDPKTPLQSTFARLYPLAIEMTLGLHDWSWARARSQPTDITSTHAPSPEWTYTYQLPTDYVTIRGFTAERPLRQRPRIPYEVAQSLDGTVNRVLYMNCDPFTEGYLIYTQRITDSTKWTVLFEQVLAAVLASEAALPMARNADLQQSLFNYARRRALQGGEIEVNNAEPYPQTSTIEQARS